jgi:hypothetical protein
MDFEAIRFYIPAAIVATLAQIGSMVNGTPSGMERHLAEQCSSSVVEMLLLSKSPTPIGIPTTIDPYCSWLGSPRSILKR